MYLIPQMQILLGAGHRLEEIQPNVHLQIGSLTGTAIPPTSTSAGTEEGFEQFLRIDLLRSARLMKVEGTVAPSGKTAEASGSAEPLEGIGGELGVGIDAGVSVGVVELTLFFVGQDFVGFGGFFEFVGGRFVILPRRRITI